MDADEPVESLESAAYDGDWQIEYLVDLANIGYCPGITLTTAAGLVTGTLIGGEEYLDLFGESYSGGRSEETKSAFLDTIDEWKQPYRAQRAGTAVLETAFIHLKDAKLFAPAGIIPTDGMLWRGRINQIIGFTVGKLVR